MATGRVRPLPAPDGWVPPDPGSPGLFTYGVDVVADGAQGVSGVWWYAPAALPTGDTTVSLYVQATQTLLAGATATALAAAITAGSWNLILFPATVTMVGGTTYTMVATTTGSSASENPAGYTIDDPTNTVHLTLGRFESGAGPYPASNNWVGQHGLDIEMVDDVPDANATLDMTLPAPTLSLTAGAVATATLDLELPAPTFELTAEAVATATLNLQLPAPTLNLTAQSIATATLNLTLPTPTFSLTATRGPTPGGSGVVDGPCDWTIDTSCIEGWDALPAHAQLVGYNLATYQLWALTGRRFGQCQITVQPCEGREQLPLYQTYPVPAGGGYGSYSGGGGPVIEDGQWYNRCSGGCRCRARCETALDGPTSTDAVIQVTVRGEVVSPAAYQIHNSYLLVRIDGECWPTCVDYSKQDPPEFTVTYLRGDPLLAALQSVAGTLAYQYGLACIDDDECRLPARLQSLSRQGVSVQVSPGNTYGDFGMTGIAEVDQLVIALNPGRLLERPQVLSPDRHRPRMVT